MKTIALHRFCLLLLYQLLFLASKAQFPDYHVRIFDEDEGIRSHDMRDLLKDNKGFLWLRYADRIIRFDGKQAHEFLLPPAQRSILCDSANQIWVSGDQGLYLFRDDKHGFSLVWKKPDDILFIGSIFLMPGSRIWIETTKGFFEYNTQTQKAQPIPLLKNVLPMWGRFSKILKHFLFYAEKGFVHRYDWVKHKKITLPLKSCYNISLLNCDQALITTGELRSYIYNFKDTTISPATYPGSPQPDGSFIINDVLQVDNGKYFVSTSQGLMQWDGATQQFHRLTLFHNGVPLKDNYNFYGMFRDDKQNIWITTFQGLMMLKPHGQQTGWMLNDETHSGKTWNNYVRSFAPDGKGNIWFATENGIAHWNLTNGHVQPVYADISSKDKMNHPSVRGLAYDGTHLIIGQTNKGIWLYNPATKKYLRPKYEADAHGDSTREKIEHDFVNQIFTLKNGNHLIAAQNAYLLQAGSYLLRQVQIPGEQGNFIFGYEDRRSRIWLGSSKNLYCLDSSLKVLFTIPNIGRGNNWARTMCEWRDNDYFVGSNNLCRVTIQNGKPIREKEDSFFDGKNITILYKDSLKRIWVGTENGFYCYDPVSKHIEIPVGNNIQYNSFYPNSFYRHPKGLLFLGGYRGINYFYPEQRSFTSDTLNVWLSRVKVNDDDSSYSTTGGSYVLRYFQNSIGFEFVAPYFSQEHKIQYRYKLEPNDQTWVYNGPNNTVRFTALGADDYRFRMAASINGRDWFESSQQFSFSISPPFWKTWWFAFFIIALVSYAMYRLVRSWQIKLKTQKMLNYFATSLYGQNTVEDVCWDIAKNCIGQLRFEDCVVYLYNTSRKVLVP